MTPEPPRKPRQVAVTETIKNGKRVVRFGPRPDRRRRNPFWTEDRNAEDKTRR